MTTTLKPDASLHYLGNYIRQIPVSLSRMMENAYDWEHLPSQQKRASGQDFYEPSFSVCC